MTYRPSPKYASKDARRGSWTTCDECGFLWNLSRMQFQYDFMGGSVPQNTGYLVCPRCLDDLNYQRQLLIIPPDPPPIANTRPEPYAVDETDWLTTEDGDILTTESDDPLITDIPNPADDGATVHLACAIAAPGGSVAVVYLDLFNGDPAGAGVSVLAAITGSATRTNIAASLTTNAGVATNTAVITVAAAAASTTNVSYVAVYDAASGGTLVMSGPLSASPTISEGAPVQFDALALSIDLN